MGSAAITLFLKIIGKIQYEEMETANPEMAAAIFFIFAIIFFFILLNMFLAIVMSHYEVLRKNIQKRTEANARIAEEDGRIITKKLWNLVWCVLPSNENQKSERKKDAEADPNNQRKSALHLRRPGRSHCPQRPAEARGRQASAPLHRLLDQHRLLGEVDGRWSS